MRKQNVFRAVIFSLIFLFFTVSYAADVGVTTSRLRIRENPNLNAPTIIVLKEGAVVVVRSYNEQWYQLAAGRHEGKYISKDFVSLNPEDLRMAGTQAESFGIEANREFIEAMSAGYMAQGQWDHALEYLKTELRKDPAHANGWGTLGEVYLYKEKFSDAKKAFENAAKYSEGSEKAQFLHSAASAAAQMGDESSAHENLSLAEDTLGPVSGLLATRVSHMRNLVRAGQPLPPLDLSQADPALKESFFSGFVGLKSGYDSNVLLLPDDIAASTSSGSFLISPMARVEYSTPLLGGGFSAQSFTAFTAYENQATRTSNSLYESVTLEWRPEADSKRFVEPLFGNRFDLSFVNSSGLQFFSWTNTPYIGLSKKITERNTLIFELPVGYQRFNKDLTPLAEDNRSGVLLGPSILLNNRTGEWSFNAGASYSDVFSLGRNFKNRGYTLLAGTSRMLFWSVRGRLSASFTETHYRTNPNERKDQRYDFSLNLSKSLPVNPRWNISGDFIYSKNDSNISTARYNRRTTVLQVVYGF